MTTPQPTLREIGRRAKQRREALELTQQQVGALASRTSGWVSRLENGKGGMRVADLVSLSVALNMPATELLMGTETRDLVDQVGRIATTAEVADIFRRIAGSLSVLPDETRTDVVSGLSLLCGVLERMTQD